MEVTVIAELDPDTHSEDVDSYTALYESVPDDLGGNYCIMEMCGKGDYYLCKVE